MPTSRSPAPEPGPTFYITVIGVLAFALSAAAPPLPDTKYEYDDVGNLERIVSCRNVCDPGACGRTLSQVNACDGTVIACGDCTSCSGALRLCNGDCVDYQSDAKHCGSCGTACGQQGGFPGACIQGQCRFLDVDPNNCGQLGQICPGITNGAPSCYAGNCTYACNPGYILCGGACVPLSTSGTRPECPAGQFDAGFNMVLF